MVARLEIRLPNGLILAVEGDPDRSWRQKPEPESMMMAKLRAAISTTEWAAVTALYGKAPVAVPQPTEPLDLATARMVQEQMQAAPRKPRVAPASTQSPSTTQSVLGGLMGGSTQPA